MNPIPKTKIIRLKGQKLAKLNETIHQRDQHKCIYCVDILPTAKAGGFWDVNGICLLNAGLTLPLPIELMPQL